MAAKSQKISRDAPSRAKKLLKEVCPITSHLAHMCMYAVHVINDMS